MTEQQNEEETDTSSARETGIPCGKGSGVFSRLFL